MNSYKEEPKAGEGSVPTPKKKGGLAGKGKFIQRILSGDFLAKEGLVQHMPFIAFLVLLFLFNIGLVYYFENTAREKVRMQNELNETRALYNTTMSRLETSKRQSNVAQSIQDMGLKELRTPPHIIDVEPGFFDKKD
jgi:hypothetical protein